MFFFNLILISDIVEGINISIDIYITLFNIIMVTIRFGLGQFIYRFNNGCLGGERWVENFCGYTGQLFVDHFENVVVVLFHSLGTELNIFPVEMYNDLCCRFGNVAY